MNSTQNHEILLQAILDNVLDGIITIDEQGIVAAFNRAAEKIFGYDAQDVIGQNIKLLMPEPFYSQHDDYLRNCVITGAKKVVGMSRDVIGRRKDGTVFPMNLAVSEMWLGEKRMFNGIVRDITERRDTLQAKLDTEARLTAILNNVLDGIITINEYGLIESFNVSSEKIFGYQADEVIGKNINILMPEPFHSRHDGYLQNYLGSGIRKIIGIGREVVGQRKDGATFPMDLAVTEMWLGTKRMFTGIVRDITERVAIEKMKREFVSTVSHELRTPLTSIRGSLGLLAGGVCGELPAQATALINIANQNSQRLILLVNDILDMEKIESGKMDFNMSIIKLPDLLKHAMDSTQAYAQQYHVHYQIIDDIPNVMINVDSNRLMQVLNNLLSNAAKFSPADDMVEIAVTELGGDVRISISDHGVGIADEFKGRIFQKFAQADASNERKKGGTGLGLAITKAIVEQMGGKIGFTSQPGVLTTFYVQFPVWQAQLKNTEQ